MRNSKTLKMLGVIVLVIVLHFYESNQCSREFYQRSYEVLEEQLRFNVSYYLRTDQDNIDELKQHIYELSIITKNNKNGVFLNRTALLYEKFDIVFEIVAPSMSRSEDMPHFYKVLNEIYEEVNELVEKNKVNHISEAEYDKIVKLLDELLEIAYKGNSE